MFETFSIQLAKCCSSPTVNIIDLGIGPKLWKLHLIEGIDNMPVFSVCLDFH